MKIVLNYLFFSSPKTNIIRYQVNLGVITSVYVCVGVYQKSSFFFVSFVFLFWGFGVCFLLLALWYSTVFFQYFFLLSTNVVKEFYGPETYLSETMPVSGVGKERGVSVTGFFFFLSSFYMDFFFFFSVLIQQDRVFQRRSCVMQLNPYSSLSLLKVYVCVGCVMAFLGHGLFCFLCLLLHFDADSAH